MTNERTSMYRHPVTCHEIGDIVTKVICITGSSTSKRNDVRVASPSILGYIALIVNFKAYQGDSRAAVFQQRDLIIACTIGLLAIRSSNL